VLATGGGAVLRPENRRVLAERGYVVYLETSVDQLVRRVSRVSRSQTRPLLETVDPREKLEQLMVNRAPLYAEVADLVVATDGKRVRSVAEQIARILLRTREHPSG
jgi:shikimate kinase